MHKANHLPTPCPGGSLLYLYHFSQKTYSWSAEDFRDFHTSVQGEAIWEATGLTEQGVSRKGREGQ